SSTPCRSTTSGETRLARVMSGGLATSAVATAQAMPKRANNTDRRLRCILEAIDKPFLPRNAGEETHGAIVTLPIVVRAWIEGAYMSITFAAGRTKVPVVTARAT